MTSERFEVPKGEIRLSPENFAKDVKEDMTDEDAKKVFDRIKHTLGEHSIRLGADMSVLDVGSGAGHLLNCMREAGIPVVGVDARPRGSRDMPQIQARIERLPFAAGTFNIVVVSGGVFDQLNYDQHQELMMSEITRVLKEKGIFYLVP